MQRWGVYYRERPVVATTDEASDEEAPASKS